MIQISKKVEYSVVLIAYMSKNKEKKLSLAAAAKRLMLPYRFLGQIATDLKNGGIIESKEGKTGGYSLVSGWEKKTLYDLMESLKENKKMVKCMAGEECPRSNNCGLIKIWNKLENSVMRDLKEIKLKEI